MPALRFVIRRVLLLSLVLSVAMAGLTPRLLMAATDSMESTASAPVESCCCHVTAADCCGSACCVVPASDPGPKPVRGDNHDESRLSWSPALLKAFAAGVSRPSMRLLSVFASVHSPTPTLQSQQVRIQT